MPMLHVPDAEPIAAPVLRARSASRRLRGNDPAVRAMTDFFREPMHTVSEDRDPDEALDAMFRLGVRAFLVVRGDTVSGLVTADDIRHARRSGAQRVQEIMTAATEMPAIDWQTLRESTVRDLMEIFRGANVDHLVVLETESTRRLTVRGLVHRARLERRLRPSELY